MVIFSQIINFIIRLLLYNYCHTVWRIGSWFEFNTRKNKKVWITKNEVSANASFKSAICNYSIQSQILKNIGFNASLVHPSWSRLKYYSIQNLAQWSLNHQYQNTELQVNAITYSISYSERDMKPFHQTNDGFYHLLCINVYIQRNFLLVLLRKWHFQNQ